MEQIETKLFQAENQNQPATITIQPPQLVIHSNNPNSVVFIEQKCVARRKEWSSSILDCDENILSCCFACFCPVFYMCCLFNKANESCWACLAGGIVPLRTKIRTQRGIKGSICEDIFCITCCGLCSMLQMERELDQTEPLI